MGVRAGRVRPYRSVVTNRQVNPRFLASPFANMLYSPAEGCPSGLRCRSRKAVCLNRAPRVRIPPLPPGWSVFMAGGYHARTPEHTEGHHGGVP